MGDLLLEDYIRNEIKETPTAEDGPAAVPAAMPADFKILPIPNNVCPTWIRKSTGSA